tara:strand:+ start:580 stop:855 length:276 start_codon:yes stop_codon:yes gene_type:complete
MTRYNMTGQGEIVPFTPEEEAAADAIEAADAAAAPMREWEAVMVESDSLMTRDVEDLIDTLLVTEVLAEAQLPTNLSEARTEKKALRGSKP